MELVNLAHIELHRIGSASSFGFASHRSAKFVRECLTGEVNELSDIVKKVAEENGETAQSLGTLHQVRPSYNYTHHQNSIVFNVNSLNVMYGSPYAVCWVEPALKIAGRYFRLEEVRV